MIFKRKWLKLSAILLLLGIVLSALLIWWANRQALSAAEGRLYNKVSELPPALCQDRVVLVFGCAQKIGDRDNLYFKYRIESAIKLWKSGMVRGFIVSGDNGCDSYNEPEDMKLALMKGGVPEDKIVCDYAGFRTLDSIVRLKKVFGEDKAIIISQQFHNQRAAYLAQQHGVDIIGLNAQNVGADAAKRNQFRERLARVKMLLDCRFGKEPKFLGKHEQLGL